MESINPFFLGSAIFCLMLLTVRYPEVWMLCYRFRVCLWNQCWHLFNGAFLWSDPTVTRLESVTVTISLSKSKSQLCAPPSTKRKRSKDFSESFIWPLPNCWSKMIVMHMGVIKKTHNNAARLSFGRIATSLFIIRIQSNYGGFNSMPPLPPFFPLSPFSKGSAFELWRCADLLLALEHMSWLLFHILPQCLQVLCRAFRGNFLRVNKKNFP